MRVLRKRVFDAQSQMEAAARLALECHKLGDLTAFRKAEATYVAAKERVELLTQEIEKLDTELADQQKTRSP